MTEKTFVPEKIDWIKLLSDYERHQEAYKDHMAVAEDLEPIVFVWSETAKMPMPNPTVSKNDLETFKNAKEGAEKEHQQLVKFEKTVARVMGNIVTAESLRRLAPAGASEEALLQALGASPDGRSYGDENISIMLSRYLMQKSLPIVNHQGEGPGTFGTKKGMRMRWDAAHNYMKPIVVTGRWDELSHDDKFAIALARRISNKNQVLEDLGGGKKKYRVHQWLRPHQERFYQNGMDIYTRQHGPDKARERIAKIEEERKKIITGEWKPYKLTDRYRSGKVQQGTIAARNIAEGNSRHHMDDDIDTENKQLIPTEGQHGPTSYDVHPGEVERMNVGRAISSKTKKPGKIRPDSVEGIHLPQLFEGAQHPSYGLQRKDESLRGLTARQVRARGVRMASSAWRQLAEDADEGVINAGKAQIQLTPHERHNWDKAAARVAVQQGRIRTDKDFGSLSAREQHRYRVQVIKRLHQNANPEIYGTTEERLDQSRRREKDRNVKNVARAKERSAAQEKAEAKRIRDRFPALAREMGAFGGIRPRQPELPGLTEKRTPSSERVAYREAKAKYAADLEKYNKDVKRLAVDKRNADKHAAAITGLQEAVRTALVDYGENSGEYKDALKKLQATRRLRRIAEARIVNNKPVRPTPPSRPKNSRPSGRREEPATTKIGIGLKRRGENEAARTKRVADLERKIDEGIKSLDAAEGKYGESSRQFQRIKARVLDYIKEKRELSSPESAERVMPTYLRRSLNRLQNALRKADPLNNSEHDNVYSKLHRLSDDELASRVENNDNGTAGIILDYRKQRGIQVKREPGGRRSSDTVQTSGSRKYARLHGHQHAADLM